MLLTASATLWSNVLWFRDFLNMELFFSLINSKHVGEHVMVTVLCGTVRTSLKLWYPLNKKSRFLVYQQINLLAI